MPPRASGGAARDAVGLVQAGFARRRPRAIARSGVARRGTAPVYRRTRALGTTGRVRQAVGFLAGIAGVTARTAHPVGPTAGRETRRSDHRFQAHTVTLSHRNRLVSPGNRQCVDLRARPRRRRVAARKRRCLARIATTRRYPGPGRPRSLVATVGKIDAVAAAPPAPSLAGGRARMRHDPRMAEPAVGQGRLPRSPAWWPGLRRADSAQLARLPRRALPPGDVEPCQRGFQLLTPQRTPRHRHTVDA